MAEETIHVIVDDAALDALIVKLDAAKSKTRRAKADLAEMGGLNKLLREIPTISRAQRLVITQIPATREALMLIYRLKMLATAGGPLVAAVIGVYMAKWYERWQKDLERERAGYETMIRRGLDISHKEYLALKADQIGYATTWDEFMAKWESKEWWDAIADYVRAGLVKEAPTVAGRIVFTEATIHPSVQKYLEYMFARELDEYVTKPEGVTTPYQDYVEQVKEGLEWWITQIAEGITEKVEGIKDVLDPFEDTDYNYDWNLGSGSRK